MTEALPAVWPLVFFGAGILTAFVRHWAHEFLSSSTSKGGE